MKSTMRFERYFGKLIRLFLSCASLAFVGFAATSAAAGEDTSHYKQDLTPDNAEQILNLVRPHGNEWRHLNVHWLTDVVAARKRAAAEDKPIIICYTGGAGYNEPLGVC